MIIYLEGLPRSGKSYESMKKHIIPALQKGRMVYARLDGLNYEQIAQVAGVPLERVKELLHHLEPDQVRDWWKYVSDKSLVILDELHKAYPQTRQALDHDTTEAVSEHGHREIDVVVMGQDHTDLHKLWRNRIDRRITFVKMDVLGKDDRYIWTMYKRKPDGKWYEVSSSGMAGEAYDKAIFGTYKSHSTDEPVGENYKDSRATVWRSKLLRLGIPGAAAVALLAVYFLWGFFHGSHPLVKPSSAAAVPASGPMLHPVTYKAGVPVTASPSGEPVTARPAAPVAGAPSPAVDYAVQLDDADLVANLSHKYRPRLAGVVISAHGIDGLVDWYDASFRRQETLNFRQIEALGWAVSVMRDGGLVQLLRHGKTVVVTSWPVEPFAAVSDRDNQQIHDDAKRTAPAQTDQLPARRVVDAAGPDVVWEWQN